MLRMKNKCQCDGKLKPCAHSPGECQNLIDYGVVPYGYDDDDQTIFLCKACYMMEHQVVVASFWR